MDESGQFETFRDGHGTWVVQAPFRSVDPQGRELAAAVLAAATKKLKDDTKRTVSRHTLPDGRSWIVKNYRLTRWWALCPWYRHDHRCWNHTNRLAKLGFPVARTLAWLRCHDGSGCLFMEDAGERRLRPTIMRLPIAEAREIAAETGRLFANLHGRRIFHTDLKPGNLMLQPAGTPGGRIVLIDCDEIWYLRPITLALRVRNLGQFISDSDDQWLSPELIRVFLDAYLGAIPPNLRPAMERKLAKPPFC
jgi:hypothetical protein